MDQSSDILVLEDLDFWQDALTELLSEAGYRVHSAYSHVEAIDTLAQHKFQLAVIDPVLDDTNRRNRDGLQVLRHILDQQPEVCIIVITASDPHRMYREVQEISTTIPLMYKDKWDDAEFLDIVHGLLSARHET